MVSSGQRLQQNRARALLRQPCSGVKFSVVAGGCCDSKPVYTVGTTPWRHLVTIMTTKPHRRRVDSTKTNYCSSSGLCVHRMLKRTNK